MNLLVCADSYVRGGADKSLTRSGRKQATANELEIYSKYSLRSSIHFLARCCNFCKTLKKKSDFFRPTRFPLLKLPPRRKRNDDFSIEFSALESDGSPTGPIRKNRVRINILEPQGGPFVLVESAG